MIPFKTGTVIIIPVTIHYHNCRPAIRNKPGKSKAVRVTIDDEGKPVYTVLFNGGEVVKPSALGFLLDTDPLFYKDFTLVGQDHPSV